METIAQALGRFGSAAAYEDLPDAVRDKAKALILHGIFTGMASWADDDVTLARDLVASEEGRTQGGARLLGTVLFATRAGAAFYGCELLHARGQDDSFRMLTHPGPAILPTAFAIADGRGISGRELIAAVAAAYEIQCRLSADTVPSAMNQRFRASALFSVFGAASAAARLLRLDANQFTHALALAAHTAGGIVETARAGTKEMAWQEPILIRGALLAAQLAARGATGAATAIEGPAGFLAAFIGAIDTLNGTFADPEGAAPFDPASITADLGSRWEMLNCTQKIYSTAGFNQPVIEAAAALAQRENLAAEQVESLVIEMNPWETAYPSPKFARAIPGTTSLGSSAMFAARAFAARGFPSTGVRASYGGADAVVVAPEVEALAARSRVVPAPRAQYAPRITAMLRSGGSVSIEMTGDEFKWDLATERARIRAVDPALPWTEGKTDHIVGMIAGLDALQDSDELQDMLAM